LPGDQSLLSNDAIDRLNKQAAFPASSFRWHQRRVLDRQCGDARYALCPPPQKMDKEIAQSFSTGISCLVC